MTMRSPRGVPVALSSSDVPDGGRMLVHSCEDCACPVPRSEPVRAVPGEAFDGPFTRVPDVLEIPLDADHHAVFGPSGGGGVVVLNDPARAVFHRAADGAVAPEQPGHRAVLRRLLEHDLIRSPGAGPPRPAIAPSTELTAWLHVTNSCNLRCPYCYVHKSDAAMDDDLARTVVDRLVGSASENGFRSLRLKFAGGEATMNTSVLFGMHDRALARCAESGLGLSAVVLSNGVAITDRMAREFAGRGLSVMISLDGMGAAHDAQRPTLSGRPSSAMVLRSVDRLIAAGCAPHISITITARNVDAVADVVRFALERDLTFSFSFFRDNACVSEAGDLRFEEAAMIDGIRRAYSVIEELMPPWSVLGSVLDLGQLLYPRQKVCGVGDDYVVVDQAGRIAQCHMELGATLGDIRVDDPVRAVRADGTPIVNLLAGEKEGCRDCTWRNWCAGGCPVATFRATGRFDVRSPNCRIYRTIYPEAIALEGRRLLKYAVRDRPEPATV